MDSFALSRWLLVLLSAVAASGALDPRLHHLYLNYIPPFQFLKGFSENSGLYAYEPFRAKRSVASPDYHNIMPHPINYPMSYTYGYGFNPMHYPFQMMRSPFRFPMMPGFNLMMYGPNYPFMYPMTPKRSAGMKPAAPGAKSYDMGHSSGMAYGPSYVPAYTNPKPASYPFGQDFMSMMGFKFNKINHAVPNVDFNFNNKFHTPSFDNGRFHFDHMDMPTHSNMGGMDYGNKGDKNYAMKGGKNYDMSYSSSYSMDMDYKDGKGHMVTKDSSYMNDNGKVEVHDDPARHYTFTGNGKPMPMDEEDYKG